VRKVSLEKWVHKVLKVVQDHAAHLVQWGHLEIEARLEKQVRWDLRVQEDLLGLLERKEKSE